MHSGFTLPVKTWNFIMAGAEWKAFRPFLTVVWSFVGLDLSLFLEKSKLKRESLTHSSTGSSNHYDSDTDFCTSFVNFIWQANKSGYQHVWAIPVSLGVSGYEAVTLYSGWRRISSKGDAGTNFKVLQLVTYCCFGVPERMAGGTSRSRRWIYQVSSATATFAMTFSSSMSVVAYYLLNYFPVALGVQLQSGKDFTMIALFLRELFKKGPLKRRSLYARACRFMPSPPLNDELSSLSLRPQKNESFSCRPRDRQTSLAQQFKTSLT